LTANNMHVIMGVIRFLEGVYVQSFTLLTTGLTRVPKTKIKQQKASMF